MYPGVEVISNGFMQVAKCHLRKSIKRQVKQKWRSWDLVKIACLRKTFAKNAKPFYLRECELWNFTKIIPK